MGYCFLVVAYVTSIWAAGAEILNSYTLAFLICIGAVMINYSIKMKETMIVGILRMDKLIKSFSEQNATKIYQFQLLILKIC